MGSLSTGASVLLLKKTVCSFNVTYRKKNLQSWEFTFLSPQPHHDEMLQQPGSRPSKNNSKKCQTSVSEMRPGEVRCILYVPPPSPSQHPLNATKSQIG